MLEKQQVREATSLGSGAKFPFLDEKSSPPEFNNSQHLA